mgnify:CR=1 FL=1
MRLPRHVSNLVRTSPDPERAEAGIDRLLEEVRGGLDPFLDPSAEAAAARLVKLLAVSHVALRYLLDDPSALDAVAEGIEPRSPWGTRF